MVASSHTRLRLDKAIEAAAELLRLERGNRMSYLRLLKLLYIADRESLKQFGKPITYDHYYALKHGPVLSQVYNLIKGEHPDAPIWSRVIERDDYKVRLRQSEAPRSANLSRAEVAILHDIANRFRMFGDWDIVDYLHINCPEWKNNKPPHDNTSRPIPLQDVLQAIGRGDWKEDVEQELAEDAALDDFFKDER